jgi:gentisate 1,2-dioxygenase
MNMLPADYERGGGASPVFNYPYSRSREVLERLKAYGDRDPCHGLKMAYIDPTSGDAAIPTISTFLQLLEPGPATTPYRTTAGTVYCVVEGTGRANIGSGDNARVFEYQARDVFVVPSWTTLTLQASEESVFFSASDEIVQRKLGIWREWRGDAEE